MSGDGVGGPVPRDPGTGKPGASAPSVGAAGVGAPGAGAAGVGAPEVGAPDVGPAGEGAPGEGAPPKGAASAGAPGAGAGGSGAGASGPGRVPEGVEWRRAPGADPADAIEVARLPDGGAALRPANDPTAAPHVYTAAEWDAFVKGVHNGEFDGPW